MSGLLLPIPRWQVLDEDANPYPGAFAYFYLTGSSTPSPVYTDADLTTEHENPVEADAGGIFPAMYCDPAIALKLILKDEDGAEIPGGTYDPVQVASPQGGVFASDGTVASTGSLTETTLATFTIPANTLDTDGETAIIRAWGTILGCTAGDRTMYVKLNGTAYATVTVDNANDLEWMVEIQITRTAANTQMIVTPSFVGNTFAPHTTATLTDTNAITVTVTGINGATAAPTSSSDLTYSGSTGWTV